MNIGTITRKIGQHRQVIIPKNIFEKIGLNKNEVLTLAEKNSIIRGFRDVKSGHTIDWKDLKHELGL